MSWKSVKKVPPSRFPPPLRTGLNIIPLIPLFACMDPSTSISLQTPPLSCKCPMDLTELQWILSREGLEDGETDRDSEKERRKLPKSSGRDPKTKIISTFCGRQQTARGKTETSSNSSRLKQMRHCAFPMRAWPSPDPSRAPQPPRSLCLWHQRCAKQNWVIFRSHSRSLLLKLYRK